MLQNETNSSVIKNCHKTTKTKHCHNIIVSAHLNITGYQERNRFPQNGGVPSQGWEFNKLPAFLIWNSTVSPDTVLTQKVSWHNTVVN